MQNFTINDWTWWFSNDDVRVWQWQYVASEWINYRESSNYITLWPKMIKMFDTTHWMTSYVDDFWFGYAWEMYYEDWTLVNTSSEWSIDNAIMFDDYCLWFDWNNIWRIRSADMNTWPDSWQSESSYNETRKSFTEDADVLYNWVNEKLIIWYQTDTNVWWVSVLDATSWLITEALINLNWRVVWITKSGNWFSIYTNLWYKYLWDWIDTQTYASYELNDRIYYVTQFEWIDYITSYRQIYASQWWQFQSLIKGNKTQSNLEYAKNEWMRRVVAWEWKVFYSNKALHNQYREISEYWKTQVTSQPTHNIIAWLDDGHQLSIENMWFDWSLFISWEDKDDWDQCAVWKIVNVENNSYSASSCVTNWELYTPVYQLGSKSNTKKIANYKFMYKAIDWAEIKISYSLDNKDFVELTTLTWTKEIDWKKIQWWQQFNQIQFKIELTKWTWDLPRFYEMSFNFDYTQR